MGIQALAGDDERLIDAHRRAVEAALSELEHYAITRQHRGQEWVVSANIVAARFDHIAARPSEAGSHDGYGPDPHLHTHVVIANMTLRPDGQWRSLDPVEIYRTQAFATAVYRSELAREVQRLGYRINVTNADGRWELEGYTREQVMAFSRRRQDIEEALNRQGLSGAAAAQIAAHQSRLAKDLRDELALKAEWRTRAAAMGLKPDQIKIRRDATARHVVIDNHTAATREAIIYSAAHNTERQAVVDRRALEARALQYAMGKTDLPLIRAGLPKFEHSGKLVPLDLARHPQGAYTIDEMLALERDNLRMMREGASRAEPLASVESVRIWAQRRGLLPDQSRVAIETLTASDWLTSIEGKAGATKTTTVGALREFAEGRGYVVNGFGPTSGSVHALEEAGIRSETVARLLASSPSAGKGRHEIWIVDESSLLSTRQVNALLRRVRASGTARVIFVGDQGQHHAIEAGRPIFQMQEAGMPVARLDTIRCQRNPELRRAVEYAAYGEVGNALAILAEQGKVLEFANEQTRYQEIAREYLRSHEVGERVLVVSPGNDERRKLNQQIRNELKAHGHIAPAGRELAILVEKRLTGAERACAGNYEVGEAIRYSRGSKAPRIRASHYGKVEGIDRERNRLRVQIEDGRLIQYSPSRLKGVQVFSEERRELAQGDRIQFRAPDREMQVANGEFATIKTMTNDSTRLRLDSGRELSVALDRLRHIDHGYASTSHASQGVTVDRVIINIDTARSTELVNRRQFYVSLSRARHDAAIYTDDRLELPRVISREQEKSVAIDALSRGRRRRSHALPTPPAIRVVESRSPSQIYRSGIRY